MKDNRVTIRGSNEKEGELAEFIAQFYDDPLGFVMAVFPWGEPTLLDGSPNPLANKSGPEPWQRELLEDMGAHIRNNMILKELGLDMEVFRSAVASGHGIGKSAIVAWLIYFLMSTRVDTRGAVTASTQFQLEDKTWPELAKWHNLAMNKHWFRWTATTFSFAAYPEDKQKNYRTTAATVSETNTEAFAGLHNEGGTVFILFDEASGVFPKIWEVADGALTDGEGFFFAFGNPTKPDGEFADCFDKHSHMYRTRNIDSREVSFTNKNALRDILRKYGDDSDEARVRVKGQFPSQSYNGFISAEGVDLSMAKDTHGDPGAGLIMAVDVARFGKDKSVITFRQGRDARVFPQLEFAKLSTMKLAEIAAHEIDAKRPDAVVIESTGPGAGVIDRLRDLGYKIIEIHPGSAAREHEHYVNKRAEYWAAMRDWIYEEGVLPNDPDLKAQLVSIQYSLDRHEQRIKLESKEDMSKRGLPSPDKGDSLALTFAVKVARRDRSRAFEAKRRTAKMEYDPFEQ